MRRRSSLVVATLLFALPIACHAQQDPPQWSSGTTYAGGGLVRASNGDFYRCLKTNSAHDPTKDAHIYWELYYVRSNLNLTVATSGATFPTFTSAWGMLQGATIAAAAKVTIAINTAVSNFSEDFTAGVSLDHPCGAHISIRGDNASKIRFNFHTQTNGFTLDSGHSFGGVSGIYMDGMGNNTQTGLRALFVLDGSSLGQSTLQINGFQYGIDCREHSTANIFQATITNWAQAAVYALDNSNVHAEETVFSGANAVSQYGVQAVNGSTVNAEASAVAYAAYGYSATLNSTIDTYNSTAHNDTVAYDAEKWSTVDANHTFDSSNGTVFNAVLGGRVIMTGSTLDSNTTTSNITPNSSQSDQSYISN